MNPIIVSVSSRDGHGLGKTVAPSIMLIAGEGVAGDAHCGVTVKHRSRVAQNLNQPNLRQVHLIDAELLAELATKGFDVAPGELGENILIKGLALLKLPEGTRLRFASSAVVRITGLRNPCRQLNGHSAGLMSALLDRAAGGTLIRKGGVMGVVEAGGVVRAGEHLTASLPGRPHRALQPV
jgi:MOSC domain-containing protein YiiM